MQTEGYGQDPYLSGGWGSSIASDRKRVAKDVYWNLCRFAQNTRAYSTTFCKGDKDDAVFRRLVAVLLDMPGSQPSTTFWTPAIAWSTCSQI